MHIEEADGQTVTPSQLRFSSFYSIIAMQKILKIILLDLFIGNGPPDPLQGGDLIDAIHRLHLIDIDVSQA